MTQCDRCNSLVNGHTMSMFNTETICLECAEIEKVHPKYEEARRADLAEIRKGNFNFQGIGKPEDLEAAQTRGYRYI